MNEIGKRYTRYSREAILTMSASLFTLLMHPVSECIFMYQYYNKLIYLSDVQQMLFSGHFFKHTHTLKSHTIVWDISKNSGSYTSFGIAYTGIPKYLIVTAFRITRLTLSLYWQYLSQGNLFSFHLSYLPLLVIHKEKHVLFRVINNKVFLQVFVMEMKQLFFVVLCKNFKGCLEETDVFIYRYLTSVYLKKLQSRGPLKRLCIQGFQKDLGIRVGIRRVREGTLSRARDPNTVVIGDLIWKHAAAKI